MKIIVKSDAFDELVKISISIKLKKIKRMMPTKIKLVTIKNPPRAILSRVMFRIQLT